MMSLRILGFLFSGFCFTLFICCHTTNANVVLSWNNLTLSFDDVEANFAPTIKGSGASGALYLAEPLNACSALTNRVEQVNNISSPFVLIIRGGCSFEEKVRGAQKAGFKAAIVYDNDDRGALVAMAGNGVGIKIHAVFVSKPSGEKLKQFSALPNMEIWIIPSFENSAWSIMAVSFISLLAMSAILATCFFVRRHHMRRDRTRASHVREFCGMGSSLVKALPSIIFTAVLEDNSTSRTCAICLEDYSVGEKIRVLPCCHKFHAFCVDSWLTSWRTFCPVCKRDARTGPVNPPASETTPLLSSRSASVASSPILSSIRSSLASSPAIQIARVSITSPSSSHTPSLASTPYVQQFLPSNHQSPFLTASRSSRDLRNTSSYRSHVSHLVSPRSIGQPATSPFNSRCMPIYIPSPSNASPNFLGPSTHQHYLLHCSESAPTLSPFASAQSPPDC